MLYWHRNRDDLTHPFLQFVCKSASLLLKPTLQLSPLQPESTSAKGFAYGILEYSEKQILYVIEVILNGSEQ